MKREEVLRIAHEAGINGFNFAGSPEVLEKFAAAIRSAIKKEDARICDVLEMRNTRAGPADCGAAIRASK